MEPIKRFLVTLKWKCIEITHYRIPVPIGWFNQFTLEFQGIVFEYIQ